MSNQNIISNKFDLNLSTTLSSYYTKQNYTKQNYTKQNYTKQNYTKQNHTKQNYTKQNYTKQNYTQQKMEYLLSRHAGYFNYKPGLGKMFFSCRTVYAIVYIIFVCTPVPAIKKQRIQSIFIRKN